MTEHDEAFARVVETLKEPVRITPELTTRVMAEVTRLPPPTADAAGAGFIRPLGWTRRRWTIRLSPLGALAAAAGFGVLVLAASRLAAPRTPAGPAVAGEAAESRRPTQFVLVAPKAASVTVVGDFNDWNPRATPLARASGDGIWWVSIPLQPGRYRYVFVVDGTTWLADPEAPAVEEEFGRPNSVITIGGA